jgi:hypothetical protein
VFILAGRKQDGNLTGQFQEILGPGLDRKRASRGGPMSVVDDIVRELTVTPRYTLPANFGVVTATDANTFRGFQLLFLSLARSHDVKLLLFDLGLTPAQTAWVSRQDGLYHTRVDLDRLPVGRETPQWQTFNKPFYVSRSPFRRTLWLDADTLVLGDLRPVAHLIARGPFLTTDIMVHPNPPELNQRCGVVPVEDPPFAVNAGVCGFDLERDWPLVHEWLSLLRLVASDPAGTLRLVPMHDQSLLRMALRKLGLAGLINPDPRWNHIELDTFTDMADLLMGIRTRPRTDRPITVMHLCGRKPFDPLGPFEV